MKRKDVNHLVVYLGAAVISVLAVIQSQKKILPLFGEIAVYVLAASALAAACICLYRDLRKGIVERLLLRIKKNTFGARFLKDYRFRTILTTMPTFLINVVYTVYNGIIGIVNQSAWFITMAVYYSLLGVMRYCAVNTERKISRMADEKQIRKKELSVIRADGILLLLLNLALTGVVLLTIRNIGVADALVSMLTLQTTMLASFQEKSSIDANRMNGITGLAICILIALLGVSMIYYAAKRKES